MYDMDVLDFARKISMITNDTPLADEYDKLHGQKRNVWWKCQREHLVIWCLHYPTGGVQGYTHKPSNSARLMYNRFGRPETLLWLAEALGIENGVLNDTIKELSEKKRSQASNTVRKKISFDKILSLVENIG